MPEAGEGDNHHNAALCPYCNPVLEKLLKRERLRSLARARDLAGSAAARYKDIGTGPARRKHEGAMAIYDAIDRLIQEEGG